MVEAVNRKIRFPDGRVATVRTPSDWSPERLKQELTDRGFIKPPEPQSASQGGFLSALGEIPGAIGKGFERGVEEVAHTGADVREAIYSALPFLKYNLVEALIPGTPEQLTEAMRNADLPSVGSESESMVGKGAEAITQFGVGSLTSPVKGGGLLKSIIQSAWADMSAFDPKKTSTLSTILNEVPALNAVIPDALVSNPDDTRWEGKIKNALEGAGIGAIADTVIIPAVKGLKDAFMARLVKEVPEDTGEAVRQTLALPAPEVKQLPPPEKVFSVGSNGQAELLSSPNNLRNAGLSRQAEQELAQRQARVRNIRNQSDAARAAELTKQDREAAFNAIQAEREAIKKAEVEEAYKQRAAIQADSHINDLIRRSTFNPRMGGRFNQGGQIDPEVFREGITNLYRRSRDLFEFTQEGTKQFGPHFHAIADPLYRSVRAELGELEEPAVKRTRVGGYNPNKMNTDEEIHQYTDELIHKFGESREVRKWDDVKRQAQQLGMSSQQIKRLRSESKNWTARVKAAHDAALDSWETTQKAAIRAIDGTPEDLQTFYTKMLEDAEILNSIVGVRSEAGRLLNSLKMMSESRGEATEQFRKFMEEKGGLESLRSIAQKVKESPTPAEGRRLMRRAIKEPTLLDAILEYQINWGFLSGPQTHIVNFLSNAATQGLSIPEMYATSLVGKLTRSSDRQSISEANKFALGFQQAGIDAAKSAWKTFKSDDAIIVAGNREIRDELGKMELEAHKAWRASTFNRYIPASVSKNVPQATKDRLAKWADKSGVGVRLPGQLLYVGDAFWKTFGYRTKLNQLAQMETERLVKSGKITEAQAPQTYQNFVNNPPNKMHEEALDNARYRTFTRELGKFGKLLQAATTTHPSLKFVVPFIRTPLNIFKYSAERTPFGLLMQEVRDNIARGGRSRDEALAKILVGSSIGGTAMGMFAGGVLTGGAPKDPQSRSNFYESGRIPYAVRIGDEWVSYSRLEPLATVMGVGAAIQQSWDYMSQDQKDKAITSFGVAMGNLVANKTFIEGIGSLIQAATEPERHGAKWLQNILSSLAVPNVLAQVARDIDPHIKQIETILDAVNQRTPWNRDEVVNRLNRWGEPLEFGGNMVNPFWDSDATDSKFLKSMYKHDIQVGMPSETIFGVELSPRLYNQFVKFGRIPARKQLEEMYNTTNLPNLSPEIQEQTIQKIVTQWDNYARQRMIPVIKEEILKRKIQETRALTTPEKERIEIKAE